MVTSTAPQPSEPTGLITEKAAAQLLGVCERTVWKLRKNGKIRCVKIGAAVRYTPEEIRRFIDSQMNQDDCSANSNDSQPWITWGWLFSCLCKCVMPSLFYFDQSFSMNYDFALVLLVLLALVVIGKPEVIRDVTKQFPPNGKQN
ncbi:helix-turn-helix domain-containing protein [Gimesia maris]|uniref:helix-turn-helix domain-containing protein n=1 Tax=Gimesia maris TaxID=122 RepID=UPI003A927284